MIQGGRIATDAVIGASSISRAEPPRFQHVRAVLVENEERGTGSNDTGGAQRYHHRFRARRDHTKDDFPIWHASLGTGSTGMQATAHRRRPEHPASKRMAFERRGYSLVPYAAPPSERNLQSLSYVVF
jgi:hypothetical protein